MSDQGGDRVSVRPLPGVPLSPRAAKTIAIGTGAISVILWTLAILVGIGEASGTGDVDSLLRSLAIIFSLTSVFVSVTLLILNRLTQASAAEADRHRAFTEELMARQQADLDRVTDKWVEFEQSIDDARWRVNKLTSMVEEIETSASTRGEDFATTAGELSEQMQTLGMLLVRVIEYFEVHPTPQGRVTPLNRRQGGQSS